ncbi:protein FAM163A-like [Boleophthalmus pectinirostris]|uniref:protein FAM163A-like n=1 Tax=Boleophthalmus pectinirostris TaxID=150288 RepID=UPI00242F7C64|nr:protein FAM163A-like [Boleophthalmus pectinirostris]XP_055017619.1 protein FAM163A-like [Boleophthalmus pectinirostris]XP_055017626.1 protein FAM163A-like [Boleophthalmus pectinirostris]
MSAGTIVITGGILAGVILLCIIAVLCYCRLQYYCCKKPEAEVGLGSLGADPLSHFPCDACAALEMDGTDITPVSLDQLCTPSPLSPLSPASPLSLCPSCSPGLAHHHELLNGGERLGFHTYYEPPSHGSTLPHTPSPLSLSFYGSSEMFPPPPPPLQSYSTDV